VVAEIGSSLDLLPTLADFAGAMVPADRVIDGVSLRTPLTGAGPSPRDTHFYYWDSELRAIRRGRYKAHFVTSGAYDDGVGRTEHTPPLLYDLAADPGERFDVAARHPEVVTQLLREAEAHRANVTPGKPLFDALLPAPSKP
jgi:uncharacterized sulfatase